MKQVQWGKHSKSGALSAGSLKENTQDKANKGAVSAYDKMYGCI
jgi:hypothetical protein